MSFPFTFVCASGPSLNASANASYVLYYSNANKYGNVSYNTKPNAVGQIMTAGDTAGRPPLKNTNVQGQLFKCDLKSDNMGGDWTVWWMIDDITPKREGDKVGRAIAVQKAVAPQPDNVKPKSVVVPVWASDGWDMGSTESNKVNRRMYYFQNNYNDMPIKATL